MRRCVSHYKTFQSSSLEMQVGACDKGHITRCHKDDGSDASPWRASSKATASEYESAAAWKLPRASLTKPATWRAAGLSGSSCTDLSQQNTHSPHPGIAHLSISELLGESPTTPIPHHDSISDSPNQPGVNHPHIFVIITNCSLT